MSALRPISPAKSTASPPQYAPEQSLGLNANGEREENHVADLDLASAGFKAGQSRT